MAYQSSPYIHQTTFPLNLACPSCPEQNTNSRMIEAVVVHTYHAETIEADGAVWKPEDTARLVIVTPCVFHSDVQTDLSILLERALAIEAVYLEAYAERDDERDERSD